MKLSRLFVYPVKSLRGLEVHSWPVDDFGLEQDRRWLVVDERGMFVSQRELPRMTLITPEISGGCLRLHAEGAPALEVSTEPGPERTVTIWADTVTATDCGPEAARWLSEALGLRVGLVRMPDQTFRRIDPHYVAEERRVSFADGYPFLLISQESMDLLNSKLEHPLGIERFRPNLVVQGASEPHAEDGWKRIRIGKLEFDLVKLCARCTVPTVDQLTGERGKEPNTTLATYRRFNGKVMFGQNLVHHGTGTLAVGEPAAVLA